MELLLTGIALYAAVGLLFAAAFVSYGVNCIDDAARISGTRFRLMILPGAAALWPLLLLRWIAARKGPRS